MINSLFTRLSRQTLLGFAVIATALSACADSPKEPKQEVAVEAVVKSHLEVHKSPTCGCCEAWVTHAQESGFTTHVNDASDLNPLKQKHGIEPRYQSCHTAISADGKYFFEGHVPAKLIQRFLTEKPKDAVGLAVPGMPVGSPGMEMGERFQPYQVLQINRDGSAEVYATVTTMAEQY